MKHSHPINKAYVAAVTLLVASALFGVLTGSVRLSIGDILKAISSVGDVSSPESRIFWYARFPRVCASLLCGAALAVSGAVIQNVLNNRLASPSVIGVNSGAGLAVTVACALGVVGGWELCAFSFIGALLTVGAVSIGAKKWGASKGNVVLLGVALNSLLGAVSDTVITVSPDLSIISNDFRIGDFSAVTYTKLIPAAVIVTVTTLFLFTVSNQLDILTLGDGNAKGLGMNTNRARVMFLLCSALLAGSAVSIAGLVSFVGLLIPHAVRRIAGGSAKHLLPLCALLGAGFVTLCDTLARTVFSPFEIPVGIIMAFLGAPFFIFILVRGKGANGFDRR